MGKCVTGCIMEYILFEYAPKHWSSGKYLSDQHITMGFGPFETPITCDS